jgi:hypothetical protein
MYRPVVNAAIVYSGSIQANETKKEVTAKPIIASGKYVVAP